MFIIEQIKTAHSKVKLGADFPAYIIEIKEFGVNYYETFVSDGHTEFFGFGDYKISSTAKYDILRTAETSKTEQFKSDLSAHQQRKTDYLTFCNHCATSGIKMGCILGKNDLH